MSQTATPLRPIEWGFPLTISRNTDVPRFWMKRWWMWMDRGYVLAPHPQIAGRLSAWSLKPDDVHSLIWWSKDYRKFLADPRIGELDRYRNFFNMTICGDPTTELRVPPLEVQLQSFKDMVDRYGVEKVQWRYSPIPADWSRFEEVADFMGGLGVQRCYFSFLHSETLIPETRSVEERRDVLVRMAEILARHGMDLLGCWDDDQFAGCASNVGHATCVDAYAIDKLYGIDGYGLVHPKENGCRCSMSVEVANQKMMPCPHACTYCYASPDNQT
jgi:hypothetical protein